MNDSRLYICVREDVPDYIVPTLVAHAVLNNDKENMKCTEYLQWKYLSFKKCVVKVNSKEFEKIKNLKGTTCHYENKTCNGEITCLIPIPCLNENLPNVLKFAKLWSPK